MDYAEIARQYGGQQDNKSASTEESNYFDIASQFGGVVAESDEQIAASLFGQSDFGEADISFYDRMKIGTGDTFEERRNIFLRNYPEGDFARVPGTGEIVFRRDPSESYRKFNPEGFDKTDVAELTGEIAYPLIGEIASYLPSLARGPQGVPAEAGRRVVANIGRGVVGAFTGESAKQAQQVATGVQEDPAQVAFGRRPATEGGFSLIGGIVSEPISRGIDAIKGAGIFSLKPGATEAMSAARRLGVEGPLPGQTTRSRIIERLQGQAGQTSPVIQNSLDRTNTQLVERLNDLSSLSAAERQFAINTITDSFDTARNNITLDLSSRTNVSTEEFGQYLQGLRDTYQRESQQKVREAYNIARSFEEPIFDATPLQEIASETARQTTVKVREQAGRRLGQPVEEAIPDNLSQVREIANQIRRADLESIGIDQLVAWEGALFDLSQPDVPGGPIREINKKAIDLRNAVRNVLNNPTNQGPEFGRAWSAAREAAAKRFDTLEDSYIAQIAKSDRPTQIANKLFDPNQVTPTDVRLIRRISGSEKFADVQAAFADRLLQDPDKLSTLLNTYDSDVLSLMLSPQQRTAFQKAAQRIDDLNLTNITKASQRQTEFQPFISDLVTGEGSTARTSALFRFVNQNGGKQGSLGRIIRTGLIEELAQDAVRKASAKTGGERVRVEAFNEALEDFSRRGLDKFFTRTELRNLKDIISVADFADIQGEGVAALLGATATQEVARGNLQGVYTLLRNLGLGNVLVSDSGRFLIQGIGQDPVRRELIIPLANTTARVLQENAEMGEDSDLPSLQDVIDFVNQTEVMQ